MDRAELLVLLRNGPVRMTMNDAAWFPVPRLGEQTLLSSWSVHFCLKTLATEKSVST